MLSTMENGTRLTTNSPVSLMLRAVSFMLPSACSSGEIISVGGAGVIIWKKLKGAKFVTPVAEQVEIHATGRGVIVEAIQKYAVLASSVEKSISIEGFQEKGHVVV